jgi:uncharacterized protein (TIGR02186 family)
MVVVLLLRVATACLAQPTSDISEIAVDLNPDHIDVGTFYDGATVQVSADLPACEDAVVVLEGAAGELTLNRKGRVAGIWLNVTQVTVSNAPQVYVLAASDELDRICTTEMQRKLHLGLEFLRNQIDFACDRALTGKEFEELLQLKRERGIYELEAPISLSVGGSGRVTLSAMLPIAPTVQPGSYEIRVYGFSDKRLICSGTARLAIKRIGLSEWLADLSRTHAAAYGGFAILVAILVGVIMGVVFHSRPGRGH